MLPFSLALVLFALLTSPAAAEEKSACSLLTSSDIEAVVGGKVSASQPIHFDDIPSGQKIVKVLGCMWGVSTMGQISISWFVGPLTDDEIAQLIKMTKNNPGTEDLKKANYKETAKDFPQAWCSTYTPPAVPRMACPCPPVPVEQRVMVFRSRS